ncbi:hypothetical protein N656DRAFT_791998 [Canariomyces notabilis]|uniref:Uncharacterized protein n=1 Tax=Canariomyces notabilis TaxID=2074819 RepID=A0AAN6QGS1_9PEZI|nr:hypothetical protein N656DRAFT_791998 [Canariomyces arenarius]
MPNLVAIDVSVTDNRVSLVFSHRAVAAAYAAYLRSLDLRPPQFQVIPGYQRSPQLHTTTKEVSLFLPDFITWFITCRLPDDEDSVTFSFMDGDEECASRWAESMVLFERRKRPVQHDHHQQDDDDDTVKELHVRRLWNKSRLLKRLDELRRASPAATRVSGIGRNGQVRGMGEMWY